MSFIPKTNHTKATKRTNLHSFEEVLRKHRVVRKFNELTAGVYRYSRLHIDFYAGNEWAKNYKTGEKYPLYEAFNLALTDIKKQKIKKDKKTEKRKITRELENKKVTLELLSSKTANNYPKQKWIMFCEYFLQKGYELTLYEARRTVSKYITISNGIKSCKIRFSNHKPILEREINQDCDFFVGRTNLQVSTARDVAIKVNKFFKE